MPWGLLLGVSHGWRCAMGIAAGRVAGAALCHGDCWWACRVQQGGAMSLGLVTRASSGWRLVFRRVAGWRPVFGIADQGLVWVAPCLWACRVGGAVPWGLLVGVSRGWRRVFGIADQGVVWVALCDGDWWWACRVGGAVSWGLLTQPLSGWRRVLGIAGGRVAWVTPCFGDCC